MRTLKDLLRREEKPVMGQETTIHIEGVRMPPVRAETGALIDLARSIERDGLRHPITVWTDGTLISGHRRLRSHFLLAGEAHRFAESDYCKIRAVFVDTIEAAAKRMLIDNSDEGQAVPLKPSEMCALWKVLRALDEPAAAGRLTEARRRGVELRKQTQAGLRRPGRSRSRGNGDEYLLSVIAEPFGLSEPTASRLWAIYNLANSPSLPVDRRDAAADALRAIDAGQSSIWANYSALFSGRSIRVSRPRAAVPSESAPAARQNAAWARSLPQMEGLVAGLVELGPPNPDLSWEQVGPVHARLSKIRRDLEKIIKGMKENAQS